MWQMNVLHCYLAMHIENNLCIYHKTKLILLMPCFCHLAGRDATTEIFMSHVIEVMPRYKQFLKFHN